MAYSRDLAVMDYHGLSWMTFMEMTVMEDCHGRQSWVTFMDDCTLLFLSYFYILMADRLTNGLTDRRVDINRC